MSDTVKLTKGEISELRYLAREARHTYGKGRARIQNSLKRKRLAIFVEIGDFGYEMCRITVAGRAALKAINE